MADFESLVAVIGTLEAMIQNNQERMEAKMETNQENMKTKTSTMRSPRSFKVLPPPEWLTTKTGQSPLKKK
jgi:hypothetical protein